MDRRAAVEQQYRSSGAGISGKKRRVGVRLKRSASVSGSKVPKSHLVNGEEHQQQSGAIESLAYEINTVVQEQDEVLGLLRRKSGLLRGLGDRFKSVIRGTDGEHDLKELRHQLNWLRKKEAQLREEKLLLLIKDVSEQPSLQAPGAVAAAVTCASAAETAANKPPTRSSKRFGFRRSASSMGIGRSSGAKAASGEAANDNDKENKDVSVDSKARQALSRRHSFGRSASGEVGSEHSHRRGGAFGPWRSQSGVDALEVDGDGGGGGGGGNMSGTDRVAVPGDVGRVHISSFSRAHLLSGGGEVYLAPNEGHRPRQFQSSGGVPISGSIWRRPMVPNVHPAPSADFEAESGGNTLTVEAVAAVAAAAAAAETADTGLSSPHASSGGWKLEPTPPLDASQDTAGDFDLAAALLMSPGVPSEMSSPAGLMRARASTNWEREMKDKTRVVMRRHSVVDRKQLPTISQSRQNSGTWASVTGSTSTRSKPVSVAVAAAASPSNTDTHTGGGLESGDGVLRRAGREVSVVTTPPEFMPVSPIVPESTAAAVTAPSPPPAPATTGGNKKSAAAKTALLRGPSSSSFEPPCEIARLVPAADRRRVSPQLEPSDASTPPTSDAGTSEDDDVVERELVPAAGAAVGNAEARVGVETLSTLPSSFGPKPSEIVGTDEADAMVDAAAGNATVGYAGAASTEVVAVGDTGARVRVEMLSTLPSSFGPKPSEIAETDEADAMVDAAAGKATVGYTGAASTEAGGDGDRTRTTKARRPSYAETASAASVTTLAVDTTREIVSSIAITPTAFQSTAPAVVAAEATGRAPLTRPPKPHHHPPEKHPLAGMGDLLTSCFAFVDATDGNPSLPEPLRKEMKRNAIASARNAEVSTAVKTETPPSVWVSQYEDMSKKYGLGFLLSDGSSGVTFKDGTKMALDADGAVFEYVEGTKRDSGSGSGNKHGSETGDPSSDPSGGELSTTDAVLSVVEAGAHAGPGVAGEKKLARQSSRQYSRNASRAGGRGRGFQQKRLAQKQPQQPQQQPQQRRRIERVGYALDDYPAHYGKKVTIAQKVRELLQRAAGEDDSAAGSTKALTPPAIKAILPDPRASSGQGEGLEGGGGADAAATGGGFRGTRVKPAKASGTGGEPLIFVDDWKRTRSSWIFRLSNRTLQVVFLDATEILLSEEARLITFVDKGGSRETMALLRALDEDRLDVIVRVRECHALIKKVIRHDERRRRF